MGLADIQFISTNIYNMVQQVYTTINTKSEYILMSHWTDIFLVQLRNLVGVGLFFLFCAWEKQNYPVTSIYKCGLSVCLYPINVKTAKPIGPKFFVGHQVTPGKVYDVIYFSLTRWHCTWCTPIILDRA